METVAPQSVNFFFMFFFISRCGSLANSDLRFFSLHFLCFFFERPRKRKFLFIAQIGFDQLLFPSWLVVNDESESLKLFNRYEVRLRLRCRLEMGEMVDAREWEMAEFDGASAGIAMGFPAQKLNLANWFMHLAHLPGSQNLFQPVCASFYELAAAAVGRRMGVYWGGNCCASSIHPAFYYILVFRYENTKTS